MITITCINPTTGESQTVASSIEGGGGGGGPIPEHINMKAKRINLSMADVRLSIDEGRAAGIVPLDLLGPGTGTNAV